MYYIYRIAITLIFILYLPIFLFQAIKGKYGKGILEKFAILPKSLKDRPSDKPTIWIQAASVGETMAAEPLVDEIRKKYPDHYLVFSTMTETGRETAQKKYNNLDQIIYFPFDITWIAKRAVKIVDPDIVVLIETEIWPEFVKAADENGSKIMVASGRISEKSIEKYKLLGPLMKKVLSKIDLFSMQTEVDAERIIEMGAPKDSVFINGNIKFDRKFNDSNNDDKLKEIYSIPDSRPVFVAGSTHDDEEKQLLSVYEKLKKEFPELIMILAPRYPKRVDKIEEIYQKNGYETIRRTEIEKRSEEDEQVIIVDTIGELVNLFGLADLVFIGGSLIKRGGHNILEPAAQGKLPFFGPHMFNFKKDTRYMLQEEAAVQVEDAEQLASELIYNLKNRDKLEKLGNKAKKLIEKNRGAAQRNLKLIDDLISQKKSKKILLLRLSAIGDVIHTLPIANAVRNKYPAAEISWIVEDLARPLVELNPYLDNVITLPKNNWKKDFQKDRLGTFKEVRNYFNKLKRYDFDLAIDVHGLFKSAFTAKSSGADIIYGPADGRELSTLFYTKKLTPPEGKIHQVERNLSLITNFGIKPAKIDYGLQVDSTVERSIEEKLDQLSIDNNRLIVVINPITTWESKNWIKSRYGEVADRLISKFNCTVIFTGGPGDKEDISEILTGMEQRAYSLAGKTTLKELTALYQKSDLFIGGDTGPMHLAAAVSLPVVALMGPTDPETHGPYGEENTVVQPDIACRNCWDRSCEKEAHRCMEKITVDEVYSKAEEILQEI